MSKRALAAIRLCAIGSFASVLNVAASAQGQPESAPSANVSADAALSADLVKTGLYVISGGGGNSLLRLSAIGSILVNGKLPGNYRPLMSQIRKINKLSDLPVRVLIVTDHHENHTGDCARFVATGVALIAQENAKPHLHVDEPMAGKKIAPTVTYDSEYRLRMGGVEVDLFHFGRARTGGDTVVYFPDMKVVAVGDLFTPNEPEPDFSAGGSLANWGPVLAEILKLDIEIVVPSEGPMVTRADLEAFKAKIDTLTYRASELVKRRVAKDQLMEQLKTDDLGWRLSFSGDQLDRLYVDLSQAR